ncbi:SCL-interrupting locus protein homolog isoform X2 [Ostrea edulis]|uniref:SCL-interrupting locus protein homolog isoform X2 n=1 Tax=Ostrea edulis TaxID=37623 RepID=UPI0024AFF047|nr:SCL-interrupting locus protein homolog isoform X2 [Ostrea edulis]XP_048761312.2 SCL-interrupting locus protein homolog isoform X2 [Ostrea edulis]
MPGQHHVHFIDSASEEKDSSQPRKFAGLSEDMAMLKFPKVKNILWDHDSIGDDVHLGLTYYRKPQLYVTEKVLRFAQRHLESSREASCSCALQGAIAVDQDGEGVTFVLDRFDPGGGGTVSCNGLAPGDISVPFEMYGNTKENRKGSQSDYFNALKLLQERTSSKDPVELSNFLLTKGWCNFYTHGEKSVHHIDFDVVTLATEFRVTPISGVPIVPTALSKNLSGPMSLSHLQGEPKSGYLTMDHTRKVLLVLESDPKVFNLPLVGIWISGVSFVYSPLVWVSCIRYLFNASINDRVCAGLEPFLLVLYSPLHSKPEFYDVRMQNTDGKLQFDLHSGYEVISLPKTITNSSQNSVELELSAAKTGKKREIFDAALHEFNCLRSSSKKENINMPASAAELEEMTPRSRPTPCASQVPKAVPMVPEVSLIFGDDNSGILTNMGPRQPPIMRSKPAGFHHIQDFLSSAHQPLQQPQSSQNPVPKSIPTSLSQAAPNSQQMKSAHQQQQQCTLSCCANNKVMQNGRLAQNYLFNGVSQPNRLQNGETFPQPSNARHHSRSMTTGSQGHYSRNEFPVQQPYPHPMSSSTQYRPEHPPHSAPINTRPSYPPHVRGPSHDLRRSCSCPDCMYGLSLPNEQVLPSIQPQNYGIPSTMMYHPSHPINPRTPFPRPVAAGPQSAPMPQYSQAFPVMSQSNLPQNTQQQSYPPHLHPAGNSPALQTVSRETTHSAPTTANFRSHEVMPPSPPQESALSPRSAAEVRNSQADSSGRSSDDSGFSVTPEKKDSEEKNADFQTSAFGKGINWNQVPPEVYQLLMQQDAQLKQLQSQIQTLIHNQSVSTQHTTMTELNSTAGKSSVENHKGTEQTVHKCEMGTNTSIFHPSDSNSIAMQTSPVKHMSKSQEPMEPLWTRRSQEYPDSARSQENPDSVRSQEYPDSARSQEYPDSARSQEYPDSARSREPPDSARSNRSSSSQPANGQMTDRSSHSSHCSHASQEGSNYEAYTPAEIRHRGVLPMNSTEREEFDLNMSQGELTNVVNNVALHNKTMDSIHSDMIVDMPSYHSSPSRSQVSPNSGSGEISQSPISASMCGDQQQYSEEWEEEEEGPGELSADNKEYYDKLMENIHKLLEQQDSGLTGENVTADTLQNDTLQQSIMLGQYLNSMRIGGGQNPVETTFIPKINYMSMMFESDSDCSMEINAMAMKYLRDEQLTQLTKLQTQSRLKGNKESHKANLLRHVLDEGKDSTLDVTTMGMSPNDITFATRKYLEKYGLVNDGESTKSGNTSESTVNDTYELKVNFSTVNSPVNSPQRTVPDSYHTPVSRAVPDSYHTPVSRAVPDSYHTPVSRTVPDSYHTPVSRKSRSPFLDSLKSQNSTGSPFHNTSGSPYVNSVRTMEKSSSPYVQNGTLSDRTGGPYTPNSYNVSSATPDTRREHMYNSSQGRVQNGSYSYGKEDSTLRTPVRTRSDSYDSENHNNTPKSTPNQRIQPVLRPSFTPNSTPGERPRMLSPIAQEEPAESSDQASNNIQQSEQDDKVLDITRLKMMPKLL